MVSEANLKKAKDMAEARADGKILIPEMAMTFSPYEYAQMLDAQEEGELKIRVENLQQEVKRIENEARAEEVGEILNDPAVRRAFKLGDPEVESNEGGEE